MPDKYPIVSLLVVPPLGGSRKTGPTRHHQQGRRIPGQPDFAHRSAAQTPANGIGADFLRHGTCHVWGRLGRRHFFFTQIGLDQACAGPPKSGSSSVQYFGCEVHSYPAMATNLPSAVYWSTVALSWRLPVTISLRLVGLLK